MKITGIATFTLRVPTVKPIALDFPEHHLVVTRIRSDSGPEGLGYSLVFGGGGSEAVEAYARRLATLLIGVEDADVEAAIRVLRGSLSEAKPGEKRATLFVVPVEKFEQV